MAEDSEFTDGSDEAELGLLLEVLQVVVWHQFMEDIQILLPFNLLNLLHKGLRLISMHQRQQHLLILLIPDFLSNLILFCYFLNNINLLFILQ